MISLTSALTKAATTGHLNVAEYLIRQGLDKNGTNIRYNNTGLICAAREGHLDIVRFFIEKKANINAENIDQNTGKEDMK